MSPVNGQQLWFVLDMDQGVIAVGRTRREAMHLATIPTRSEWRGIGPWEHHRYGPHSEEFSWSESDDEHGSSFFVEHGTDTAKRSGWSWALDEWRDAGERVGVRMSDLDL